ncbi:transcriptional regulator [Kitasatospora sp. NPDC101235]|uniref:transcriptional regulator n=1 Tax=Kitasatospora sp. NPDC101235 TaxID=3364101 RepID=UPI00381FC4D5
MTRITPGNLLVLHTVRTLGHATAARLAERTGLPQPETVAHLLDAQARGWVTHSSFAGESGWSLTEAGSRHGEQLLAAELDTAGARTTVEEVYRDFLPANDQVAAACTAWQLTELAIGEQRVTLTATITALTQPARTLAQTETRLTAKLARFAGYHHRFTTALHRANTDPTWITGIDRDSCHRVWFELHEDLIATLGLTR